MRVTYIIIWRRMRYGTFEGYKKVIWGHFHQEVLNTTKGYPVVRLYLEMGHTSARVEIQKTLLLYKKYILLLCDDSPLINFFKFRMNFTRRACLCMYLTEYLSLPKILKIGFLILVYTPEFFTTCSVWVILQLQMPTDGDRASTCLKYMHQLNIENALEEIRLDQI